MEGENTDQHNTVVIELSIENFTCWNNQLHGKSILQEDVTIEEKDFHLELFPNGITAFDEYLVVRVYDQNRANNGELSIIDSKGSLLWKKTVCNPTWKDNFTEISTNLIFEDVVKNIVQDPMFKDVITLQYTRKCTYNELHQDISKVHAFDRLVKIPSEILRDLPLTKRIRTFFSYNFNGFVSYYFEISSLQSTIDGIECSFDLRVENEDGPNLVHCYLYVLNSDNSSIILKETEYITTKENSFNFKHTFPNDTIEGLFSLLIRFKIAFGKKYENCEYISYDQKMLGISNILHSSIENYSKGIEQQEKAVPLLSKELMCLYQDHDFSDFQLRCESVTFPVHKIILSAHSPVFKCMLTSDMREAVSNCLDIVDLDPHTLGRFLTFLYSGTTKEDQLQWEGALKLYYAADKYQVPSLKAECAAVLKNQVSVSNVCDILALAERHQDEMLKAAATDFILINYADVLESKEWESFMLNNSLLLCKTLTLLGRKKKLVKMCVFAPGT